MTAAFFDELEKISALSSEGQISTPAKPTEVKPPFTPTQIKPKAVEPQKIKGTSTNYTRSNVEAPGTDVGITLGQKVITPPPIRV